MVEIMNTIERSKSMNKVRYPKRLPQPRVSLKVYRGIKEIAKAQEMRIAEVIRAALEEYIEPHPKSEILVNVPIIGVFKDGKIYLYRDGDKTANQVDQNCPQEVT